MFGIYLHIPFCRKACTYCDFHFVTTLQHKGELVHAMSQEIAAAATQEAFSGSAATVYFGGGTPSLLSEGELDTLLNALHKRFFIASDAEITLEANPDDLTPAMLRRLKQAGINRLSIGIQSFDDAVLTRLNRSHNAQQAEYCVKNAQDIGIYNISIDVIFGIPDTHFETQLRQAIALQPRHLSAYALTVEEKTALYAHIRQGKARVADESAYQQEFMQAHDRLSEAGYTHYELSNYAQTGFESRHNGAYWAGVPYLGFGPAAHSFDGSSRWWNVANNAAYIQSLAKYQSPITEREVLTPENRLHEYLMTGLRTAAGIDLAYIRAEWGADALAPEAADKMQQWQDTDLATRTEERLQLTPSGWLISDALTLELL